MRIMRSGCDNYRKKVTLLILSPTDANCAPPFGADCRAFNATLVSCLTSMAVEISNLNHVASLTFSHGLP